MKKLLFFLLITSWLGAQWSISNAERDALIGIYNTTNGAHWSQTWDLTKDPRTWYGIIVKNSRVQEINLKGNALKGTFPANLATFQSLKKIDLSNNQLSGELSPSVSSLANLIRLDISNNRLTGDPAIALGNFSQLEEVNIGNNLFEINNVDNLLQSSSVLKILNLSNLELTTVPQKISSYTKLTDLDLSNNKLIGGFNNLRGLTSLQSLSLSGNQLKTIPADILVLNQLTTLDLSHNQLSALSGINNFSKLEWLSLENNLFTQVPVELKQISKLYHLNLGRNKITSAYANLMHFKNLQQLFLNDNGIKGAFPSELLTLSNLMMLSVANNNLEGSIPTNIPTICDLSNNRFTTEAISNYISNHQTIADRLYYSPQRYDKELEEVLGILGQSAKLSQSLSGDDYSFSWFKNLGEYTQVTTENYNINKVQENDYGTYTAEAFYVKKLDSYIMQLSLFREPISLVKVLGTDDNIIKDIRIYPNPASDFIHIYSSKYQIETSTIYDLSGKQILTTKQQKINISHLPSGTYIINIKTNSGYKNFKFIKQ